MLSIVFSLTVVVITAGFDAVEVKNQSTRFESGLLELPSDFDSRDKFKECAGIIGHVRDQSNCGSCAAMAVIGVFNDRLCIKTGGAFNKLLSPGYAVACCTPDKGCEAPTGCQGATSTEIWSFAQEYGIPTGGDYTPRRLMAEADGCWPYNFARCDHTFKEGKYPACSKEIAQTPSCSKTCRNPKYRTKLSKDRHFVAAPGEVDVSEKPDEIKREIFVNGSVKNTQGSAPLFTITSATLRYQVTAVLKMYEDFKSYESDVYRHKTGSFLEKHLVKLIGWGKTSTEEYWLAVNSWNEEWGESGLFRIAFGECEIEKEVTYGVPELPS